MSVAHLLFEIRNIAEHVHTMHVQAEHLVEFLTNSLICGGEIRKFPDRIHELLRCNGNLFHCWELFSDTLSKFAVSDAVNSRTIHDIVLPASSIRRHRIQLQSFCYLLMFHRLLPSACIPKWKQTIHHSLACRMSEHPRAILNLCKAAGERRRVESVASSDTNDLIFVYIRHQPQFESRERVGRDFHHSRDLMTLCVARNVAQRWFDSISLHHYVTPLYSLLLSCAKLLCLQKCSIDKKKNSLSSSACAKFETCPTRVPTHWSSRPFRGRRQQIASRWILSTRAPTAAQMTRTKMTTSSTKMLRSWTNSGEHQGFNRLRAASETPRRSERRASPASRLRTTRTMTKTRIFLMATNTTQNMAEASGE